MSEKRLSRLYYYFRDLFFTSLGLLLFLLIIEDVQPGFVSFWLEMKYVLFIVLVAGVLTLLKSKKETNKKGTVPKKCPSKTRIGIGF